MSFDDEQIEKDYCNDNINSKKISILKKSIRRLIEETMIEFEVIADVVAKHKALIPLIPSCKQKDEDEKNLSIFENNVKKSHFIMNEIYDKM